MNVRTVDDFHLSAVYVDGRWHAVAWDPDLDEIAEASSRWRWWAESVAALRLG